jgi:hypothetical protein
MLSEKNVKLEARLLAIEYMIAHLNRTLTKLVGATPEMAEAARATFRKSLGTSSFPGLDPATSDLMAGELEEAFERLFETIREIEVAGRS